MQWKESFLNLKRNNIHNFRLERSVLILLSTSLWPTWFGMLLTNHIKKKNCCHENMFLINQGRNKGYLSIGVLQKTYAAWNGIPPIAPLLWLLQRSYQRQKKTTFRRLWYLPIILLLLFPRSRDHVVQQSPVWGRHLLPNTTAGTTFTATHFSTSIREIML